MTSSLHRKVFAAAILIGGILCLDARPLHARGARITIVNMDGPNTGLNDPTPATPVGGNSGTTLGAQRLNVFQAVADTWSGLLDSPVEIRIEASFTPLSCDASSAVLGSTGPIQTMQDFQGAQFPGTWYAVALANKQAGKDLAPGDPKTNADDIQTRFNSSLGAANCLSGVGWYYGLDNNHGGNIDLFTVLLHEYAHGLGFLTFVSLGSGTEFRGHPDVYERNILDLSSGKLWTSMTDAERSASAVNTRHVVWAGNSVTANVPGTLSGTPTLTVSSPSSVAGNYSIGAAAFGAPLTDGGVTGTVVAALDPQDASGPSQFDACSPLSNASAVRGKIALIDRGTCLFVVKVKNAQDAGAIGAIIADNVDSATPAGLGGDDPSITIPAVRVTKADGATLRASLDSGTSVTLHLDATRLAGSPDNRHLLLYAPNPIEGGSSISHWDTSALPNLLMEPNINTDLKHDVDLTLPLLRDIGWFFDPPDCISDPLPGQNCQRSILKTHGNGTPRVVKNPQ